MITSQEWFDLPTLPFHHIFLHVLTSLVQISMTIDEGERPLIVTNATRIATVFLCRNCGQSMARRPKEGGGGGGGDSTLLRQVNDFSHKHQIYPLEISSIQSMLVSLQ